MKKITLFSIVTATVLVTGCSNSTTKEAANKAAEATSSAVDTLKNKASEMAQTAKDKAAEAVEAAEAKTEEIAAAAKARAEEAATAVKEKASGTMDAVKDRTEAAAAATKEKVAEAVEATKAKTEETATAIKEKAAEAVSAVKEKAVEAASTTEEKIPEAEKPAASAEDKSPVTAADTSAGKVLYAKCAGCHGADGKTRALGKSDPIAGLSAEVIAEDLKGYKAGTLNKHSMGSVMKGQAAGLSDADIAALSAYIAALK